MLNETKIVNKPVIHYGEGYWLFMPELLVYNLPRILENALAEKDPVGYAKFKKERARQLEVDSISLLTKALDVPGNQYFLNLHFPNGELDGLIIDDDALILVECKAGKLKESVARGSVDSFSKSMDLLVAEAFNQTEKALNYINSQDEVVFLDKAQKPIATISRNKFTYIFAISVYEAPIGNIASNMSLLKDFGVITHLNHCAFFIDDLKVICEVVEPKTMLLNYFLRRQQINSLNGFRVTEELDWFMMHISHGLPIESLTANSLHTYEGLTIDLDKYYNSCCNPSLKPIPKIPKSLRMLIDKLETQKPQHYITACLYLLDFDGATREMLSERVRAQEKKCRRDRTYHSLTLGLNDKIMVFLTYPTTAGKTERQRILKDCRSKYSDKSILIIAWESPLKDAEMKVFVDILPPTSKAV